MKLQNIKRALETLKADIDDDLHLIDALASYNDETFCNYIGSSLFHEGADACDSVIKKLEVVADLLTDAAAIAPPVDTAAQMADDLADPLGDDEDISPEDVITVGAGLAETEFVDEIDDESGNDYAFVNRDLRGTQNEVDSL